MPARVMVMVTVIFMVMATFASFATSVCAYPFACIQADTLYSWPLTHFVWYVRLDMLNALPLSFSFQDTYSCSSYTINAWRVVLLGIHALFKIPLSYDHASRITFAFL